MLRRVSRVEGWEWSRAGHGGKRQEAAEGCMDAVGSSGAAELGGVILGVGRAWLSTDLTFLLCLG